MPKAKKTVTIVNRLGLHARACATFIQQANRFSSEIRVKCFRGDPEVNGKSILGMMMLAVTPGSKIIINADGIDAQEAVDELARLVEDKFGEEA
ncbi:TPA: HPr family phosphocarrier protein [bacterium]|nr:HPr family phosphocarrier protein [bacterium]